MKKLLLAPIFFILGCATPTLVQGPDGTPHNLISCINLEDCYNEAAQTCHGKYEIVHTANQGGNSGSFWMSQPSRVSILVKCQPLPPGSEPAR